MPARILITGGGTAGHTNPGIAIAEALVARGLAPTDVHFVGGVRSNEGELVADAGFTIDLLPGRGIRRSVAADALKQNAVSSKDLALSVFRATKVLRRFKPDVVVCLGGYASFAATTAALALRIPVVVSEQNARASDVNRLVGRFATICALPYPDTDLPNGVLTGNPILARFVSDIAELDRSVARERLGIDQDKTMVAVWAGSLGATRINEAAVELTRRWRDRTDVAVYHIVGRRDWEQFQAGNDEFADDKINYTAVSYEDRMPTVQMAADVAICRCGASTTSELAVTGLPAILIPLPIAPHDHQRANARELVDAGGAVLLDDDKVSAEALEVLVSSIVAQPEGRAAMAAAAASVGRPNAALDVADLVLDLASESA